MKAETDANLLNAEKKTPRRTTDESLRHDQPQGCTKKHRCCLITCGAIVLFLVLGVIAAFTTSFILMKLSNQVFEVSNSTQITGPAYPNTVYATPPFHDCGGEATLHAVFTDECTDEDGRCRLRREVNGTMEIVFTPKKNISKVTFSACARGDSYFTNLVGCVPKKLANPDACEGHNLKCPLIAGQMYVFRTVDRVSKSDSPMLEMTENIYALFIHKILDENNRRLVCIEIPVIV